MKVTAALTLGCLFVTEAIAWNGWIPTVDDTMKRHRITVQKFKGENCDQRNGKDHLQMYKCKNLKPGKDANSITFHLPHRHKKDSCDILIYENFNCEGEPYIMTGHPENADKCVSTPNAKSIFIGPCKDKELLWTDDRQSIVVGYEPLCGFPSSIC